MERQARQPHPRDPDSRRARDVWRPPRCILASLARALAGPKNCRKLWLCCYCILCTFICVWLCYMVLPPFIANLFTEGIMAIFG